MLGARRPGPPTTDGHYSLFPVSGFLIPDPCLAPDPYLVSRVCENRQMRSRIQTGVLPSEAAEFREELRRIFQELDQTGGDADPTGECSPPLDVIETDTSVDIVMDLPGVNPDSVRILMRGSTVLIAGQKAPRRVRPDSSFHLVERGYGRFARAVRLASACDGGRASAVLAHGELRISLPRIVERRGRSIRIAVSDSPTTNA